LTGPPGREMGGIRFEPNGDVTIITGTLDYGQGHASPFAQVLATRLGIPFQRIRLLQGDSDELIAGGGTGGSKSMIVSGNAIVKAGDKVVGAGRQIAAHVLEAAAADIEFRSGRFVIIGTDRSVGIMELAAQIHAGLELPPELPQSLDVADIYDGPPSAFPNGCHIAEVEVDPDTGTVDVVRYTFVNDFGVVINPLLVDGQAHGGIVQGIGAVLFEECVYSEDANLLNGTMADYLVPMSNEMPDIVVAHVETPETSTKLGAKGIGEAGLIGAMGSVWVAVNDALKPLGAKVLHQPFTPERVLDAIARARDSKRDGQVQRGD